jgi:WhiB family redox-sensing transcriptional regulator
MMHCRAHALAYEEAFGIWGGLTEDERCRQLPDRAVRLRTHRAHDHHDMTGCGESCM